MTRLPGEEAQMIIVEGSIRISDPQLARPAMVAMVLASREEDGCIDYAYAFDLLDPLLVRVSERWTTREALAAHLVSEHIGVWRSTWPDIGISHRSLRLYEAEPESV